MKIAISTQEDNIDSKIDQRFGRCMYFLIVDIKNKKIANAEAFENEGRIQGHGAGIKAAQQVGELDVENVITGAVGPNAENVLNQMGVKIYHASGIAKEAVEDFINDKLGKITEISEPHPTSAKPDEEEEKEDKIFIPLLDNMGEDSQVSPHFGHAPFFGLYDLKTKKLTITENKLDHSDPLKSPVDQIVEAVHPTIVLSEMMGQRAVKLFSEKGISLKTGPFKTVKELIENSDKMEDLTKDCGH
ncbi:MAG: hypothetical protein KAR87_02775 [Candidatus Aenigmarchaeota archaeon]|nr:hypothetical protein [Candidatus Aenigmarchaeota archaeon]